jgi:NAD(P)-dependent dehydrogenase (short-subunit alcohol dehydrogenase family)
VHVPYLAREHADALVGAVGATDRLRTSQADLADRVGRGAAVRRGRRTIGRWMTLLNLAGGFAMAPIDEGGIELWERMIALNATSAFLSCGAAVPRLKRAGGGRIDEHRGRRGAGYPRGGMSAYVAAKAAVAALTRSLAKELARDHYPPCTRSRPPLIDTPDGRWASLPDGGSLGDAVPPEQIRRDDPVAARGRARDRHGAP